MGGGDIPRHYETTILQTAPPDQGVFAYRSIISLGWGSTVWPDTHLNYMIDIALTNEFTLTTGSAR